MEENGKVVLREVKTEEFESLVKETDDSIHKIAPVLNKLFKALEKKDPTQRFFLCDAIIGSILNSAKLPSYLLASIASKYFVLGTLPHLQVINQPKADPHPSYLG